MYSSPPLIENFEADQFNAKIHKELEKVEAKLYKTGKLLVSNLEYEEHNKQYRRKNYLERYRLWLEECVQDLDDIHRGIIWKYCKNQE